MSPFTEQIQSDSLAAVQILPVSTNIYIGLEWVDNNQLITQADVYDGSQEAHLGTISFTDTHISFLGLPSHLGCEDSSYITRMPRRISDTKITYLCRCSRTLVDGTKDYLMIYDTQTGISESFREFAFDPLSPRNKPVKVSTYTFFPDHKRGFLIDTWSGSTQLHAFDTTSVEKVDLGVDVVWEAELSPDGQQMVIAVQEKSDGSISMLDKPYSVELVDPNTWKRKHIFTGYWPHSFRWSPDGKYIAFGASETYKGSDDVWLLNVQTGAYRRIAIKNYGDVSWSPDGTRLAATRFINDKEDIAVAGGTESEIVILDLATVEFP